MSKFKFVNIVDIIFISIATLLIIFAWVQFFIKTLLLSLILSAIISIGVLFIIRYLKSRKYATIQSKSANLSNLALFKLAIPTMPSTKLTTIIKRLLPGAYLAKIYKGDINFTRNNTTNTFTFYYSSILDETKLLELIKTKSASNLTIFCFDYSPNIKPITKAFKNRNIELVNIEQLFEIFNSYNIKLDTSHIDLSKPKISLKEILKNSLSHNKSKGYFISGLILLFTSLIIPYKIYYVVFSSILFILSLICRFKPSPKPNYSIFD